MPTLLNVTNIFHGKYQYVKLIILISNFILIENFYITQQRTIEDVYPENFIVDIGENIDGWISCSKALTLQICSS